MTSQHPQQPPQPNIPDLSFERARLLFKQKRYTLAETEVRRQLAREPDNAEGHALLALILWSQNKHQEALEEAHEAIHLGPEEVFPHFALGQIFYFQNKYNEAEATMLEALRFNPHNARYFDWLAVIYHDQGRWAEALDTAERGLRLDPLHVGCLNMRALSLFKLGRVEEAQQVILSALQQEPDNSQTHAFQGWMSLGMGSAHKAVGHLRESLRLDPEDEWTQRAILEALKARNIVYRLLIAFIFWVRTPHKKIPWGKLSIFVGGWSMLLGIALFWKIPILLLILLSLPHLGFMFLFYIYWTRYTVGSLLLRFDRLGRQILSPEQSTASNWAGGFLLIALLGGLTFLLSGHTAGLILAFWGGMMPFPLSSIFRIKSKPDRILLTLYTFILALIGLSSVGLHFISTGLDALLFCLFGIGCLVSFIMAATIEKAQK